MSEPMCRCACTVKDSTLVARDHQNFQKDNNEIAGFDVVFIFTHIPLEATYKNSEDRLNKDNIAENNSFKKSLFDDCVIYGVEIF